MSCPTCDHELRQIGDIFHCPRCGTLLTIAVHGEYVELACVPQLVERCRKFEEEAFQGTLNVNDWIVFGIAEAINKPEGRPS